MIELDFAAVGARIAHYRKMNGLSAKQLAEAAGSGLTRPIVANIESGRRQDIGIAQLLAIAWALRVPPVALILPIDRPNSTMRVDGRSVDSLSLVEWFQGWSQANVFAVGEVTNAGHEAGVQLMAYQRLRRIQNERDALADAGESLERLRALDEEIRSERQMLGLIGITWSQDG